MLIEVYRGGWHTTYHETETGRHILSSRWATGEIMSERDDSCWHSPENPCPAVTQEKGEET